MKVVRTVLRGRGDSNVALLPDKAARGTDGRIFPWGNTYDENKANKVDAGKNDTTPVGSFSPQGDSPYGVTDMAGNVWEWCQDWYDEKAYQGRDTSRVKDPTGPTTGTERVLRGGAKRRPARFSETWQV